jgi:hypothetical protein
MTSPAPWLWLLLLLLLLLVLLLLLLLLGGPIHGYVHPFSRLLPLQEAPEPVQPHNDAAEHQASPGTHSPAHTAQRT